jgi:uncharacterized membrane protein
MMPDPLHPAVVHLPIALAVLMPAFALAGIYLIYKGFLPGRSWAAIVLLQALLVGSGWLALETGEDQEERVERVVAERHIETHEEAAERFLVIAGIGLLLAAGGLLPGRAGAAGRVAGTLATLAVLAAGVSVGHSGGELVYKHGAASAYVGSPGAASSTQAAVPRDDG